MNVKLPVLTGLFLFLMFSGSAIAESGEVERLTNKASSGNVEAQFELAWFYYDGNGVDQSDMMAAHWWRTAAKEGHPKAQTELANLIYLESGNYSNVPSFYLDKALFWLNKAAAQGYWDADDILNQLHDDGLIKKNGGKFVLAQNDGKVLDDKYITDPSVPLVNLSAELKSKVSKSTASGPELNVYLGNARAEKQRVTINNWVAECWNDKIDLTTFVNDTKSFVSISAMDHTGVITFRGNYRSADQTFAGKVEINRYWDVNVRGGIKNNYAIGSIWYTLKNAPGWNTDGFCISHFKAKKKDI